MRAVLADQPEPPAYFARMKRMNAPGRAADAESAARGGPAESRSRRRARHRHAPVERVPRATSRGVDQPAARTLLPDAMRAPCWIRRASSCFSCPPTHGTRPTPSHSTSRSSATTECSGHSPPWTWSRSRPGTSRAFHPLGRASCRLATPAQPWSTCAPRPSGTRDTSRARVHVPLPHLTSQLSELRGRQPIVTYCQSGSRSVTAASVLRAAGIADVSNADGGFDAFLRDAPAAAAGQGR